MLSRQAVRQGSQRTLRRFLSFPCANLVGCVRGNAALAGVQPVEHVHVSVLCPVQLKANAGRRGNEIGAFGCHLYEVDAVGVGNGVAATTAARKRASWNRVAQRHTANDTP